MKKLINIFMAIAIILTITAVMPITASASNAPTSDYRFRISNGEVKITRYIGTSEEITIPETINGYPVTTIGMFAFSSETCPAVLKSVIIPDSVITIEAYAFDLNTNITNVTIGNNVVTIGIGAFFGTSIENLVIPDSVTTIGDSAFGFNSSLISVTIGTGVTVIPDYAFSHCFALTSVIIPNNVTTIGVHAFMLCRSLTNVTIGTNVTTIGFAAFGGTYMEFIHRYNQTR